MEIFDTLEAIPAAPKKLIDGFLSWAKGEQVRGGTLGRDDSNGGQAEAEGKRGVVCACLHRGYILTCTHCL